MSELIKHECGIALIRLKKPLQYYRDTYGTVLYPFNKLFLLMEKQHNRGQDGAGIGVTKLDMDKGKAFMHRERTLTSNALSDLFRKQLKRFDKLARLGEINKDDAQSVKENFDFGGEVLMGHLRYGTSGSFGSSACHPYFRRSNWPTRNLMVCGNFNMTNTPELNQKLIERGQHPIFDTDTQTVLEEIGFYLDEAHQELYRNLRDSGVPGDEIQDIISRDLDMSNILRETSRLWDGGYVIAGMVGNGDCFVMRDPHGIRPCYYFENDDFIAFASERVPLMTVFNLEQADVREVPPGYMISVKSSGEVKREQVCDPAPRTACTFERIYFSRGNDPDIYQERKALGGALVNQILDAVDHDWDNSVFSFIPNTAEIAFYGMLESLRLERRKLVKKEILAAMAKGELTDEKLDELILSNWPRSEKIAHKDIKLRTFISQEKGRSKMVSHVYDVSYGALKAHDNLVVLDDSIVRGTTLRESIIKILSRTNPKKIVIASTAPQIRYPDCYGIDMSELGKFIAFQAAIALLKSRGMEHVLAKTYEECLAEAKKPAAEQVNKVKQIYEPFTAEEISAQISKMLTPKDIPWKGDVQIIYQTIENLHRCLPENSGDWYFTGDYPTPGGINVVNRAYLNFYLKRTGRSYDMDIDKLPLTAEG
ncbi:MAG: amidophosphoribosyltransferase [Opitutales bacterium]|nr:amidophosphoribosyltransferase [Opitutales bacterium]